MTQKDSRLFNIKMLRIRYPPSPPGLVQSEKWSWSITRFTRFAQDMSWG